MDEFFKDADSAAKALNEARETGEPIVGDAEPEPSRVIEPDPDTRIVDLPEPRFKNADDVYDVVEERREEIREERALEQAKQADVEKLKRRAEIQRAGNFNDDEVQVLGAGADRVRRFENDVQIFDATVAHAQQKAASGELTQGDRQILEQARNRLAEEAQWVQQARQETQAAIAGKRLSGARAELLHDIPELQDEGIRKSFVRDMARKYRTSPERIEQVRDPLKVREHFVQWEKNQAEKRRKQARAAVAEYGKQMSHRLAEGPPESSADARERLAESGSIHDAAAWLAMARKEKEHGLR